MPAPWRPTPGRPRRALAGERPPGSEDGRAGEAQRQQRRRERVLDRLEAADRHAELLTLLHVVDGHVEHPLGSARPAPRRCRARRATRPTPRRRRVVGEHGRRRRMRDDACQPPRAVDRRHRLERRARRVRRAAARPRRARARDRTSCPNASSGDSSRSDGCAIATIASPLSTSPQSRVPTASSGRGDRDRLDRRQRQPASSRSVPAPGRAPPRPARARRTASATSAPITPESASLRHTAARTLEITARPAGPHAPPASTSAASSACAASRSATAASLGLEAHRVAHFLGSPSSRSATMLRWISFVPGVDRAGQREQEAAAPRPVHLGFRHRAGPSPSRAAARRARTRTACSGSTRRRPLSRRRCR